MRWLRCSRLSGGFCCGTWPFRSAGRAGEDGGYPFHSDAAESAQLPDAGAGPLSGGLVRRNVSALVDTPHGREGRPSQALSVAEAAAFLEAAEDSRLHAYIVLFLLTGVRSEEARALTWDHVDLEAGTVSVWRSVRAHGDAKTVRSRRTLRLPQIAVEALRGQVQRQAAERANAGELWQEQGLVFTTTVGTAYESHNLRRVFRRVTVAAGLGARWVPKELRTSFVSMMSYQGVPVEEIARLAGHASSRTTEVVYRRELRPVITTGAEVMDQIFRTRQLSPSTAGTGG